ncbi:hypothetical protein ABZ178_14375 [Streptomyces massasporeus]|uniref:hypothetical protein n=1 Tax=Streptomyces massasporeus TaxID=67324 RepID=UPI0033BA1398
MIKPESIPLFTGDLGQLEQHTDALRKEADGIRQAGGEAHRQFQGLSAFYQAPEAEDLFASTKPVSDAADSFGDKVATVADALRTYAAEVAPIAKRLEQLQSQAATFVAGLKTDSGAFDENWTDDADKVSEHQALMHDVNVAQEQFAASEIACNNKITALVGGTQYVMNTGAKQLIPRGAELYGYSADVLDQAKELPWGTPVTQSHDWWDPDDLGYYAKSFFWDGIVVDNVWGTIDGLATLAGFHGSDSAGQAWEGVVRAIVGAETYLMESGGQKPTGIFASDFAQESKGYAKEFAKGFVAWDMWDENPSRAAATVVFNGLTLGVGPLKAASAGKAGAAAKTAATVAKVGEVIDPLGAAVKVTGHAIPRITQVTESLRGVNKVPALRSPHSVLEFSDASGRSVLVVEDGRFVVLKDGKVVSDVPMRERSVTAETSAARERDLAGVGATPRTAEATAQVGDNLPPRSSHETPLGHSGGETHPRTGEAHGRPGAAHTAGSEAPTSGAGTVGNSHVSTGSGSHAPGHGPSESPEGAAGRDGPTGSGDHTPAHPGPAGATGSAPPDLVNEIAPERYSRTTETAGSPSEPMRPEQEAGLIEELSRAKITPQDQARVIRTLSKEPYGAEVADLISHGHLSGMKNYDEILKMCKQGASKANKSMVPAAYMALSHATELHSRGFSRLAFELKDDATGLDLDVTTLHADGTPHYGYQLKDVDNIEGIKSAAKKAASQLKGGTADAKIAILDVHRSVADLNAKMFKEAEFQARRSGATFHLRFTDGSVTVPPNGPVFP